MMRANLVSAFFLLFFLVSISRALDASAFCNTAINVMPTLGSGTSTILIISLLIVFAVLAIQGIIYAIGKGFGIPYLLRYVQKEYIESVFNIVLIIIVVGGMGFADSSISFLANTVGSMASQSTSFSPITITSAKQMFFTLCTSLANLGINEAFIGLSYLIPAEFTASLMNEFTLAINYKYKTADIVTPVLTAGFQFTPFDGIYPNVMVLGTEEDILIGIATTYIGLAALMVIIYGLMPIFLYAGILLRSFPWTRAAGGAMLSLFISFFIIFPAIAYGFTSIANLQIPIEVSQLPSLYSTSYPAPSPNQIISNPLTYLLQIGSGILTGVQAGFQADITKLLAPFIYLITAAVVDLLGIIIALIIAYDLLEGLADLLGAPSLSSSGLLNKVI